MAGTVIKHKSPKHKLLPGAAELLQLDFRYEINEVVCDRYYILDKQEAFSCSANIFFCLDIWNNTPCVLKEISARSNEKKELPGREARNIAKIPFHKNVIQLLRLEVIGGSIFMVLEWLPYTLLDIIKSGNEFSADKITDVIFSICCGLQQCINNLSSKKKIRSYRHKT